MKKKKILKTNKRKKRMFIPTVIMGIIAVVLLVVGYYKGEGQHLNGLQAGMKMIIEIVPLLIFAFIVAGMIQILLPSEMISRWVGIESGFRGILLGTLAGAVAPGGPYVSLPIAAGLLKSGAGVGTMVAFLTGWSLWALGRLPMEVGILGWKFTLIRLASTFIFPPLAGLIAQLFFGGDQNL
jgi:uncharacterized membrane protein YraQ (UPF0718 family)